MSKAIALATAAALLFGTAPVSAIEATPQRAASTPAADTSALKGGGGLGIFGCSSDGNKQTAGAVVGGLLGGFLGNRIAGRNSRTLGTVLGGALGAAGGSALGCKLQRNDRQKAERAVNDAVATNESQTWQSDETGASGKVEVSDSLASAGLANMKLGKGIEPADGYAKVGKAFVTTANANIRSRPGLDGKVMGQLPTGTRVWVPASVSGTPWYLVSDNGVGQGYVSNALVKAAVTETAANSCKMVKQTVNMPGASSESETYQACKGGDGQWVMTRV